jgi:ankyrin repeat protein
MLAARCKKNGYDICRELVVNGADINLISDNGDTALSEAITQDN